MSSGLISFNVYLDIALHAAHELQANNPLRNDGLSSFLTPNLERISSVRMLSGSGFRGGKGVNEIGFSLRGVLVTTVVKDGC